MVTAKLGYGARELRKQLAAARTTETALRALHEAEDVGGGRIVCTGCGELWPCQSLQLLDDMPPP